MTRFWPHLAGCALGQRARACACLLVGMLGLTFCRASAVAAPGTHNSAARERTEKVGSSELDVVIEPGRLALDDASVARLIGDSARAMNSYYGTLPFARARVIVTPSAASGIHGSTRCSGVGRVHLELGPRVQTADFAKDWVITHELLHVAFTSLEEEAEKYDWVGEGLSSYVEPLVRVRAGTLGEDELWGTLLWGAPQGLPEAGDQGLDRTHTWGRTYWGGALFWFEVDLLVREQTQNQRSIRDALRAIAAAGTNICTDWPLARVLDTGDRATGTHVLAEVYARRGLTNASPDVAGWFKKLGVGGRDHHVVFDDTAPWAAMRHQMTRD